MMKSKTVTLFSIMLAILGLSYYLHRRLIAWWFGLSPVLSRVTVKWFIMIAAIHRP